MTDGPQPAPPELERLRRLHQAESRSAVLHAMRASAWEAEVAARANQVDVIRRSTSWRLTAPLRFAVRLLTKGPRTAFRHAAAPARSIAQNGLRRLAGAWGSRKRPAPSRTLALESVYARPVSSEAPGLLAPRVLIIAELSLPQCAKYRVWQKQAHLALLGTECTVLDWSNVLECRSALQVHAVAIFYRVPGYPRVLSLIAEAKRLGVATYWEADDLIFDIARYRENRNLDTLDPALKAEVLAGVPLFRDAMLECDRTIASTTGLAAAMQALGAVNP